MNRWRWRKVSSALLGGNARGGDVVQSFLLRWLFNAVAIYLTTLIIRGISVPDFTAAVVAALVLGIVNAFIRPLVLILTLPVNILTLGLFTLVVNALMLYVVSAITSLQVTTFTAALVGALLIALISMALSHVLVR
jgi:putative membrane protein